ncbi:MAG: hypothetical protein ABEH60_07375 [Halonotius sp.]
MDSRPALYSPTGYGSHDGEAVLRTPHTVKTLRGEDVETILDLLSAADGNTVAADLVDDVAGATAEYVDSLYEHDLAYDARAIPATMRESDCGRFLESVLPAIPPATHHGLPERLASLSVAVVGDREPVSPVLARLRAAGVTVTDDVEDSTDVIVLSEALERAPSWSAVTEQWLDSDATLIKTRLTATGWRLGPVLTPAAPVCLNCIYSRIDANRAGGRLYTETLTGDPPFIEAYTETVTELALAAVLEQVPRYLDEQMLVYNHYEGTLETPRVFALPNCEVCAGV